MRMKACERCDELFEARPPNKKFCSPECVKEYRREYAKKNFESRRVTRQCRYCGKDYRRPYEKSGFCSRSCGSKWNVENGKCENWVNHVMPKRGKKFPCVVCGSLVYRPPRDVGKEGGPLCTVLCSKNCLSKFMSARFSGEDNPFYGKKHTQEAKEKQKKTLRKNHGVENAWELAKHSTVSKSHAEIHQLLCESFPKFQFSLDECVKCQGKKYAYYADIFCSELNLIVEFHGSYWHCDARCYHEDYVHPHKKMTAREIWEYDANRKSNLETTGKLVYVIYEYDYSKCQEDVIEQLLSFVGAIFDGKEKEESFDVM